MTGLACLPARPASLRTFANEDPTSGAPPDLASQVLPPFTWGPA